jgi:hypothetical protein
MSGFRGWHWLKTQQKHENQAAQVARQSVLWSNQTIRLPSRSNCTLVIVDDQHSTRYA